MTCQQTIPCLVLACLAGAVAVQAGQTALAKDLSKGGTVLLVGDSIFDCHDGDKRIEVVLRRLLQARDPELSWRISNEAHGGEYIGPREGNPRGVSSPLFTTESTGRFFEIVQRHPQADVVIVNYAANDSKVYPPGAFRQKLEMLAGQLERVYPGAVFIFCTSMYLDPAHSAPYHIEESRVASFKDGDSRNDYLEPYNQEVRAFTAAHSYQLADTFRRLRIETQKGNWDMRLRADEGDPTLDPQHQGDMKWFDNIHPNDKGTETIAQELVEILLSLR